MMLRWQALESRGRGKGASLNVIVKEVMSTLETDGATKELLD